MSGEVAVWETNLFLLDQRIQQTRGGATSSDDTTRQQSWLRTVSFGYAVFEFDSNKIYQV